jgi:hypothetical protein
LVSFLASSHLSFFRGTRFALLQEISPGSKRKHFVEIYQQRYCLPFIRTYAQTGGAEAARTKLGMRLLGVTTWYCMQLGAILAEEMVQRAWKEVEKHLPLGKGSIICCRL